MGELMDSVEIEENKKHLSELLHIYMAGDSHEHTVFSNPKTRHEADYTFEQVFNYVREELKEGETGMEFVILAEHPTDAGDPKMIDGKDLLEHQRQIHEFMQKQNEKGVEYPHLYSGVEADIISKNGDLDLPSEVLKEMDIVVGSKHDLKQAFPESNGQPNASELTNMYLGLMENPNVDVIGHINRYISYEALEKMDWDKLLTIAKETNTALEININAPMPKALIKKVVAAGVPIFIGTDSHTLKQYQNLPNEARESIETDNDRLKYPLGVKYSFWKQISKILRTLEEVGCPPEQVVTSSHKLLDAWLSKEKSERKIEIAKE